MVGYLRGGRSLDKFRSIDVGAARCVPAGIVDELADSEANGERGVDCVLGGGVAPGYYNASVTTATYHGKSAVPAEFRYPVGLGGW